jgi:hypothetical protein
MFFGVQTQQLLFEKATGAQIPASAVIGYILLNKLAMNRVKE